MEERWTRLDRPLGREPVMLLYEAVLREGAAGEGTVKGMRKGLRGSPSFDVTRRKEKRCTLYTVSNTRKLRLQHCLDFTRRDATHQTDLYCRPPKGMLDVSCTLFAHECKQLP